MGAGVMGPGRRFVGRAVVDDDDEVDAVDAAHRPDGGRDPVGFVLAGDDRGDAHQRNVTCRESSPLRARRSSGVRG